jgi:hypothetical protein
MPFSLPYCLCLYAFPAALILFAFPDAALPFTAMLSRCLIGFCLFPLSLFALCLVAFIASTLYLIENQPIFIANLFSINIP